MSTLRSRQPRQSSSGDNKKKSNRNRGGNNVSNNTDISYHSPNNNNTSRIITSNNTIIGDLSSPPLMLPHAQPSSPNNESNRRMMSSSSHSHSSPNSNNNTNTSKMLISPEEKADFNARLEKRRRQRHDQRLRRVNRKDLHQASLTALHGGGRYRGKYFMVFVCCFSFILCGWIVGFYLIAQDLELIHHGSGNKASGIASPLQLLQQTGQNKSNFLNTMKDSMKESYQESKLVKSLVQKLDAGKDYVKNKLKRKKKKNKNSYKNDINNAATVLVDTPVTAVKMNTNTAGYTGGIQTFSEILEVDHGSDEVDSKTIPLTGDSSTVIDMRVMSDTLPFVDEDGGAWKQGFEIEPISITNESGSSGGLRRSSSGNKKPPLKIFIVPHSHNDPGWIQTFDEYFQKQTKQILSSIVEALMKSPHRTFIWAEMSYFEWWWKEQSAEVKNNVRHLLKKGQLEFVTGGWVQTDEANTQLYAMEIQLQEGHDFIQREFGTKYIPKYGWSIDPFGYSPTMAYLLKKHHFKGMVIQRVHYAIKKELALHKNLEFMWRQTWDNGSSGAEGNTTNNDGATGTDAAGAGEYDILTHVMPFYSYDVPHTCGPDPAVCCQFDFARLKTPTVTADYVQVCPWKKSITTHITPTNIQERSLLLLDQYRKKANLYRSNTVLIPLGDDFRYRTLAEAEAQYHNYALMMDYINTNVENVEISFGTLSNYFQTIMNDQARRFSPPLLKGSFFTYSDRAQDYWSGYYTSRIFDKALDRQLERVLYVASSLGATNEEMQAPRRALSLFQHHDGVTGTAKDYVVADYAQRIHTAIKDTQHWIVVHLVAERSKHLARQLKLQPCWQSTSPRGLSHNVCDHSTASGSTGGSGSATSTTPGTQIIVYNPLETVQYCGSIEVPGRKIALATLPCETPGPISNTSGQQKSTSTTTLEFDPETGLLIAPIREEWMVWKVKEGGAYLFVPGTIEAYPTKKNKNQQKNDKNNDTNTGRQIELGGAIVTTKHWKRTVVEREIRPMEEKENENNNGGSSSSSSSSSTTVIDFIYETNLQTDNEEWFVRYTSPLIDNQGVFHTDLNGYNFDTHHFRPELPLQSQVFPMPTLASIEQHHQDPQDTTNTRQRPRMTIISEHAQGAASIQPSAIDIWLDRRLAQDDERGLAQGVRDNVPTRTRLRVVLEDTTTTTTNKNNNKASASSSGEFEITPFCKRQWKELNHPLELFGAGSGGTGTGIGTNGAGVVDAVDAGVDAVDAGAGAGAGVDKVDGAKKEEGGITSFLKNPFAGVGAGGYTPAHPVLIPGLQALELDNRSLEEKRSTRGMKIFKPQDLHKQQQDKPQLIGRVDGDRTKGDQKLYNIGVVYMVYKRVDYFKRAIETLRTSDYPKSLPIIISHDGHVTDMVEYVESLKVAGYNIIQLFHPYSCAEHPHTFPGDDPTLNEQYPGDSFGNKRDGTITCCKHHFTWLINTVFSMKKMQQVEGFLFLEEDYIVAPTIYETIQKGFSYIDTKHRQDEFFGLTFDPSIGYAYTIPKQQGVGVLEAGWLEAKFITGPVAIRRDVFAKVKTHGKEYCTWDDYNWDWSLVHLMAKKELPFKVLSPGVLQVAHIGLEDGMHTDQKDLNEIQNSFLGLTKKQEMLQRMKIYLNKQGKLDPFHNDVNVPHVQRISPPKQLKKGFGGWGHPADQEHCITLFEL